MMSKELKALKVLKCGYKDEEKVCISRNCFDKNIIIIETALKALEIIKEKEVNISYMLYHFEKGNGGYREYCRVMKALYLDYYPSGKLLTQKEYDLLKEVLL